MASSTAEIPDEVMEEMPAHPAQRPARQTKPGAYVIPWEERRSIGRQRALFKTWRAAVHSPSKVFSNINSGGGYLSPLLYGTIWILFGLAGGLMWRFSNQILPKILVFIYGKPVEIKLPFSLASATAAFVAIGIPLIATLSIVAMCVVFHLFAIATIRKHAGFKTTLRVICYSAGAFGLFLVPAAGGLLAGLSLLMMVAIGFREAHKVSLPHAVATAFVPCALLLMAGLIFASWAVEGSKLDFAHLFGWLLPFLSS
jgi:hypothetical protein